MSSNKTETSLWVQWSSRTERKLATLSAFFTVLLTVFIIRQNRMVLPSHKSAVLRKRCILVKIWFRMKLMIIDKTKAYVEIQITELMFLCSIFFKYIAVLLEITFRSSKMNSFHYNSWWKYVETFFKYSFIYLWVEIYLHSANSIQLNIW